MKPIVLPKNFNYIAVFLTLKCQYNCAYCINKHGGALTSRRRLTGEQWVEGLRRIGTKDDLPITLQGGEPTLHKDFYHIVNAVRKPLDLLTNLDVDAEEFITNIPPSIFKRNAPYASIRVSYHHGQCDFTELMGKVLMLQGAGYSIGVWEIDHPDYHLDVVRRQHVAKFWGIDYRLKEFLGKWKGEDYGTMRYGCAVSSDFTRSCSCRTTELVVDPAGDIFRCHSDLYAGSGAIANIMDDSIVGLGRWLPCSNYGKCNACDIKITTNRFQEDGHSSVEIKDVKSPHTP